MSLLNNHLKATIWMLFGLFFVFTTVILMNESGVLKTNDKRESAEFSIQKIAKPQPKPKPRPKPKPKPSKPKQMAPAPQLEASLSGVDTGLDAFMMGDMAMGDGLLGDVGKEMTMSEDSVDVAPKPTLRSAMSYPKKARKSGVTGYVLMNLLIDQQGFVEKVKVLESEPAGIFDDVAVNGVKSWQFKPAQYQGEAVKVWAKQKIRFDLQ